MAGESEFDFGTRVKIEATFTDRVTGALIDPDTVAFHWEAPGGAVTVWTYNTDPEVIRVSLGTFRVVVDGDAAGNYDWAWRSSGNGKGAKEGFFYVNPSNVG